MKNRKFCLLLAVLILSSCFLFGCESMMHRKRLPMSSNYSIQSFSKVLKLHSEGRTSKENIVRVLRPVLAEYNDIENMQFVVTTGTGPTALSLNSVIAALDALGIGHKQISKSTKNQTEHTSLRIIGYKAVPPAQYGWQFPVKSYESVTTNILDGSTVNANRGVMLANPRNGIDRRRMDPADGEFHGNIIKAYRNSSASTKDNTSSSNESDQKEPVGSRIGIKSGN